MWPERAIACSVVAANHLPRMRVLASSLRRHHPQARIAVLVLDATPAGETFDVLSAGDIAGVASLSGRAARDPRAAASEGKPALIAHLLDRGHESVLYLDADMLVTASLDPLLAALLAHDVVLTPHRLSPPGPVTRISEDRLLLGGATNAGVVGVRASTEGRAFASWWAERVRGRCVFVPEAGLHWDQRWLDAVPGLFGGVHLLRDPGVNVAYWNLDERPLAEGPDGLTAGLARCRLLHLSGYDPRRPRQLSRYAAARREPRVVRRILRDYRRALQAAA
jgi:hypothetical protein